MATNFFVPGPAHVAVGTGASKAMQYLGLTRDGAHVSETQFSRPVIADYAGPEMPADKLLIGKIVTVSFRLVRFDPAVLASLTARHFLGTAGSIGANEIGTLLLTEGAHFPLMIKSPYQSKAIFTNNLPGINVLNCLLDQSHDYNMSTVEQEHNMVFVGHTFMDPATLTGSLWNTTMTNFPTIT